MVWIHGGGWTGGNADVFLPHATYCASRGAVGVSINYRLLKPQEPTMADCLADCKSAIRYLRAHAKELGIDPKKIVALGDSAGGHLAAALGTIDGLDDPADDLSISAQPDAMVLYNPIVDMTDPAWIRSIIAGAALERNSRPQSPLATPEQQKLARALSPVLNIKAHQPPTLLMHGLADTVVLPEQARRLAAAIKEAGNQYELVLLEGARHAFVMPRCTAFEERVVNAICTTDRFLAKPEFLADEPRH
jgi:acetyl esterase/lipase